jgi:hypothetical protein
MRDIVGAMLVASIVGLLSVVGMAMAQASWVDDIANSVSFYRANYPGPYWDAYQQRLALVKTAVQNGDQRAVKVEMGKWFKMLRQRDHGISDVAADELFNFSLMVTPIQEYGIAVPAPAGGAGELAY